MATSEEGIQPLHRMLHTDHIATESLPVDGDSKVAEKPVHSPVPEVKASEGRATPPISNSMFMIPFRGENRRVIRPEASRRKSVRF